MAEIDVCPLAELPPGTVRIVEVRPLLCGERVVVCPRHGARFDIQSGRALTLPAYIPVDTYPVRVRDDGIVVVDVGVEP